MPIQAEVVQYLLDGYPEGLEQVDDGGEQSCITTGDTQSCTTLVGVKQH